MLEKIHCIWWLPLPEQQPSGQETIERRVELRFRLAHHRCQQSMRKLTPNSRANLRHFLGGAQPI
jgi:hypothetical protein